MQVPMLGKQHIIDTCIFPFTYPCTVYILTCALSSVVSRYILLACLRIGVSLFELCNYLPCRKAYFHCYRLLAYNPAVCGQSEYSSPITKLSTNSLIILTLISITIFIYITKIAFIHGHISQVRIYLVSLIREVL